jgi:hypothetical protein
MSFHTLRLLACVPSLVSSCAMTRSGGTQAQGPAGAASAGHTASAAVEAAVEIAQLELEAARLDADSTLKKAESAVADAELDLQAALAAMESFQVGREIRMREAAASLERSKVRLEEQKQELAELESMYAAEEFAEKTKELVLARGKNQLAAAQESLAIETLRRARLEAQELPADELARRQALIKAENGLRDARKSFEAAGLRAKLGVMRAEKGLREAEKKAAGGEA